MSQPPPTSLTQRKLAVALEYTGVGAPKVTAKGQRLMAEQIIELAKQHDIPIQENAELVGLLAQLDIGQDIPEQLYAIVAALFRFIYHMEEKSLAEQQSLLTELMQRNKSKD